MSRLKTLDSFVLSGLRVAVDSYKRYEKKDPEAARDFAKIIRSMLDVPATPDPYEVLSQIAAELERRTGTLKVELTNPDTAGLISALTPRQREIFVLAGTGLKPKAIGQQLGITQGGVNKHLFGIGRKLGLARASDIPNFYLKNVHLLTNN